MSRIIKDLPVLEPIACSPLLRLPVALVWLYQGFWCKLCAAPPGQVEIIHELPGVSAAAAQQILALAGIGETALGIWILTGIRARWAALTQTVTLVLMNAGGLLWARQIIPDPAGRVFQSIAFLTFAWIVANRQDKTLQTV